MGLIPLPDHDRIGLDQLTFASAATQIHYDLANANGVSVIDNDRDRAVIRALLNLALERLDRA